MISKITVTPTTGNKLFKAGESYTFVRHNTRGLFKITLNTPEGELEKYEHIDTLTEGIKTPHLRCGPYDEDMGRWKVISISQPRKSINEYD